MIADTGYIKDERAIAALKTVDRKDFCVGTARERWKSLHGDTAEDLTKIQAAGLLGQAGHIAHCVTLCPAQDCSQLFGGRR